jgi:argininosuccinate synthase
MTDRIVLAYSGGPESSAALAALAGRDGTQVITATLDLGQAAELEEVHDRALALGAARAHVFDARDRFARDFILPALQAGALEHPLATPLAIPLIARTLVDVAGMERATAVAHTARPRGTGPHPLDIALRSLSPGIAIVQAARQGLQQGTPDVNLWGRSCERAADQGDRGFYAWTNSPANCPGEPAYVEITFERGVPAAINGVAMPMVDLIASLRTIAGAHGVGRGVVQSARVELHEAPAAVVLHKARRGLHQLVTSAELARLGEPLTAAYARLVRDGRWFTPEREAIDAFVQKGQEHVSGVVRLKLFKAGCDIVSLTSPHAPSEESSESCATDTLVFDAVATRAAAKPS